MNKKKYLFTLILLILAVVAINYPWMNFYVIKSSYEKETGIVERVIDGDTIVVDGKSIRLLGINTPEKGEEYYGESKIFLENLVLNKKIGLEKGKDDLDKYGRKLRYVFLYGENIDILMIKNGFANPYFPSGKDKYADEFYNIWNKCLTENKNLCEKSQDICKDCFEIRKIEKGEQEIIVYNRCDINCNLNNWSIKGEGRKIIKLNYKVNKKDKLIINTENIWIKTGDSLFLRDGKGKLVLYYNYFISRQD